MSNNYSLIYCISFTIIHLFETIHSSNNVHHNQQTNIRETKSRDPGSRSQSAPIEDSRPPLPDTKLSKPDAKHLLTGDTKLNDPDFKPANLKKKYSRFTGPQSNPRTPDSQKVRIDDSNPRDSDVKPPMVKVQDSLLAGPEINVAIPDSQPSVKGRQEEAAVTRKPILVLLADPSRSNRIRSMTRRRAPRGIGRTRRNSCKPGKIHNGTVIHVNGTAFKVKCNAGFFTKDGLKNKVETKNVQCDRSSVEWRIGKDVASCKYRINELTCLNETLFDNSIKPMIKIGTSATLKCNAGYAMVNRRYKLTGNDLMKCILKRDNDEVSAVWDEKDPYCLKPYITSFELDKDGPGFCITKTCVIESGNKIYVQCKTYWDDVPFYFYLDDKRVHNNHSWTSGIGDTGTVVKSGKLTVKDRQVLSCGYPDNDDERKKWSHVIRVRGYIVVQFDNLNKNNLDEMKAEIPSTPQIEFLILGTKHPDTPMNKINNPDIHLHTEGDEICGKCRATDGGRGTMAYLYLLDDPVQTGEMGYKIFECKRPKADGQSIRCIANNSVGLATTTTTMMPTTDGSGSTDQIARTTRRVESPVQDTVDKVEKALIEVTRISTYFGKCIHLVNLRNRMMRGIKPNTCEQTTNDYANILAGLSKTVDVTKNITMEHMLNSIVTKHNESHFGPIEMYANGSRCDPMSFMRALFADKCPKLQQLAYTVDKNINDVFTNVTMLKKLLPDLESEYGLVHSAAKQIINKTREITKLMIEFNETGLSTYANTSGNAIGTSMEDIRNQINGSNTDNSTVIHFIVQLLRLSFNISEVPEPPNLANKIISLFGNSIAPSDIHTILANSRDSSIVKNALPKEFQQVAKFLQRVSKGLATTGMHRFVTLTISTIQPSISGWITNSEAETSVVPKIGSGTAESTITEPDVAETSPSSMTFKTVSTTVVTTALPVAKMSISTITVLPGEVADIPTTIHSPDSISTITGSTTRNEVTTSRPSPPTSTMTDVTIGDDTTTNGQSPTTSATTGATSGDDTTTSGPSSSTSATTGATSGNDTTTSGPSSSTSSTTGATSGDDTTTGGPPSPTSVTTGATTAGDTTTSASSSPISATTGATTGGDTTTSGPPSPTSATTGATTGGNTTTNAPSSPTSATAGATTGGDMTTSEPPSRTSATTDATTGGDTTTSKPSSPTTVTTGGTTSDDRATSGPPTSTTTEPAESNSASSGQFTPTTDTTKTTADSETNTSISTVDASTTSEPGSNSTLLTFSMSSISSDIITTTETATSSKIASTTFTLHTPSNCNNVDKDYLITLKSFNKNAKIMLRCNPVSDIVRLLKKYNETRKALNDSHRELMKAVGNYNIVRWYQQFMEAIGSQLSSTLTNVNCSTDINAAVNLVEHLGILFTEIDLGKLYGKNTTQNEAKAIANKAVISSFSASHKSMMNAIQALDTAVTSLPLFKAIRKLTSNSTVKKFEEAARLTNKTVETLGDQVAKGVNAAAQIVDMFTCGSSECNKDTVTTHDVGRIATKVTEILGCYFEQNTRIWKVINRVVKSPNVKNNIKNRWEKCSLSDDQIADKIVQKLFYNSSCSNNFDNMVSAMNKELSQAIRITMPKDLIELLDKLEKAATAYMNSEENIKDMTYLGRQIGGDTKHVVATKTMLESVYATTQPGTRKVQRYKRKVQTGDPLVGILFGFGDRLMEIREISRPSNKHKKYLGSLLGGVGEGAQSVAALKDAVMNLKGAAGGDTMRHRRSPDDEGRKGPNNDAPFGFPMSKELAKQLQSILDKLRAQDARDNDDDDDDGNLGIIIAILITLFVLIILAIILILYWRRRKNKKAKPTLKTKKLTKVTTIPTAVPITEVAAPTERTLSTDIICIPDPPTLSSQLDTGSSQQATDTCSSQVATDTESTMLETDSTPASEEVRGDAVAGAYGRGYGAKDARQAVSLRGDINYTVRTHNEPLTEVTQRSLLDPMDLQPPKINDQQNVQVVVIHTNNPTTTPKENKNNEKEKRDTPMIIVLNTKQADTTKVEPITVEQDKVKNQPVTSNKSKRDDASIKQEMIQKNIVNTTK